MILDDFSAISYDFEVTVSDCNQQKASNFQYL